MSETQCLKAFVERRRPKSATHHSLTHQNARLNSNAMSDDERNTDSTVSETFTFPVRGAEEPIVVLATRRSEWPETTSSAHNDETGRVAWRALPALCAWLCTDDGRTLITSARAVLELGAGLGTPGMLCARLGAETVTLTDGNSDVVADLRVSIRANDELEAFAHCTVNAEVLMFGKEYVVEAGAISTTWPCVVASDVVYSASSAGGVLETIEALLAENGQFILAYVSRWLHVDRALYDAIEGLKFIAESVPAVNFLDVCEDAVEERPCLFKITRAVDEDGRRVLGSIFAASSTCGREWFDAKSKTFKLVAIDALTANFARDVDALFAAHGSEIESIEVNGKGPYKITLFIMRALLESLTTHGVRVSSFKFTECWLDLDSWRAFGQYLGNISATHTIHSLEIRGEDITASALQSMVCDGNAWIGDLRRLLFSRCEQFDAAGAQILREEWFRGLPSPSLESFDIEFCPIGDAGIKELCALDLHSLHDLRLSSVDVSALGLSALTSKLAHFARLRALDLSGNEQLESSGAAELSDRLIDVGRTLEILDLRGCHIGDQGLYWLSSNASALRSLNKLKILRIGSNGIGDDSMEQFASYLKHQTSLITLDLSMNVLSWNGAYDLTDAFEDATNDSLRELNLKGNHIGTDGVEAVAEVIENLKSLQVLDLTDVDVGEKGVTALLDALVTPLRVVLTSNSQLDGNDELSAKVRSNGVLFANIELPKTSNRSVGIGR